MTQNVDNTTNSLPSTWKFSLSQYLENSRLIRWIICLLLLPILSLFLHLQSIRFDIPQVNSISQKTISSPIDFEFYDEVEMSLRTQKAISKIGKIYKIKSKDLEDKIVEYEQMIYDSLQKNSKRKQAQIEELISSLDFLKGILLNARYTSMENIAYLEHSEENKYLFIEYNPVSIDTSVAFPEEVWKKISSAYVNEKKDLRIRDLSINLDFFKRQSWVLKEDIVSELALQDLVRQAILPVYRKIDVGTHLVEQGKKVASHHIALLNALKETLNENQQIWNPEHIAGSFSLSLLFMVVGYYCLKKISPKILLSNKELTLLTVLIVFTLGLAKLIEYFWLQNTTILQTLFQYPIIIPLPALLIALLTDYKASLIISILLSLFIVLGLTFDKFMVSILNILISIFFILSIKMMYRRKDIFSIAIKSWMISSCFITSYHLYIEAFSGELLACDLLSSFIYCMVIAILSLGFLPLFESMFKIITDLSLMEYTDPSFPLLRRLSTEAPGTYQHTLSVSHLAESAALAIQANDLLCKVTSLYHDIGKLANPNFFIENRNQEGKGKGSEYDHLSNQEAAEVILKHISDGIALARKEKLPEIFIDIIKEHHGTTLSYYFYKKECDKVGSENVDIREFRYSGPKPQTKESAIIMIADSVEAASRCLDEVTEKKARDFVDEIVDAKMKDGQLDECPLTFEELCIIKAKMVEGVLASCHSRIKYTNS